MRCSKVRLQDFTRASSKGRENQQAYQDCCKRSKLSLVRIHHIVIAMSDFVVLVNIVQVLEDL
jgi:hypothetical protein